MWSVPSVRDPAPSALRGGDPEIDPEIGRGGAPAAYSAGARLQLAVLVIPGSTVTSVTPSSTSRKSAPAGRSCDSTGPGRRLLSEAEISPSHGSPLFGGQSVGANTEATSRS